MAPFGSRKVLHFGLNEIKYVHFPTHTGGAFQKLAAVTQHEAIVILLVSIKSGNEDVNVVL